jgi:hypothetical protein
MPVGVDQVPEWIARQGLKCRFNLNSRGRIPVDLLRPFESDAMKTYEANPKVNNVRNNGPGLMRQSEYAAESGQLPL